MSYKWESTQEWLKWAVKEEEVGIAELLNLVLDRCDSDDIQDYFSELMDEDGYFDEKSA